jgi:hypothetical protein
VLLRRAWHAFGELDASYEAARTRVLLAKACRALGDGDGEALELRAARSTFAHLNAAPDLAALNMPATTDERELPGDLTAREVEILSLVALGKTNRAIAEVLIVSEKTVASHISHNPHQTRSAVPCCGHRVRLRPRFDQAGQPAPVDDRLSRASNCALTRVVESRSVVADGLVPRVARGTRVA